MTYSITIAKNAARHVSRITPTLTEGDLLGVCWERAARAEARIKEDYSETQQKAYIWKAAYNAGIDAYRKENRDNANATQDSLVLGSRPRGLNIEGSRGRQASQRSDPLLLSAPESPPSLASSRERSQAERSELCLLFFSLSKGCTPLERKALFLLSVEGIPQRDIATKLGCSFPAVRQLLSRGRRKCEYPHD